MNSPLKLLENNFHLPREVLDKIQIYLVNDTANNALKLYFDHLYTKKNLYEEFIFENYVYPKCYCNNCPDNGVRKIFKKKDCDPCFIFESTFTYVPNDFNECVIDNPQFKKIYYDEKKSIEFIDEYDEYEYEYEC